MKNKTKVIILIVLTAMCYLWSGILGMNGNRIWAIVVLIGGIDIHYLSFRKFKEFNLGISWGG